GFNRSAARFIYIEELRDMYQGEPLVITNKAGSETFFIGGVVISNSANGETESRIIVQNYADGQLRGIALSVEEQTNRYQVGDSIVAKVEGRTLERVNGILQVSGLTIRAVGRISTDNAERVHIETDNFRAISAANSDTYE